VKPALVVDASKRLELEPNEHWRDLGGVVNPVGVEVRPLAPDRKPDEQPTCRCEDPCEFGGCTAGAVGSELVAIAAETHVLDDVQTRQRLDRLIVVVKIEQIPLAAFKPRNVDLEWAEIDEGHRDERREAGSERYPRSDVNVASGA